MQRNTITYRGKNNLDFGLYWDVGTDFELGTGEPNVEQTDIPGVSGTQLDFNNSYKSFTQKFSFYAVSKEQSLSQMKAAVTTWLLKEPGYGKLVMSSDPDYYYLAAPDPSSVIKWPAYNKNMAKIEIQFIIKPFKYRFDGQHEIPFGTNAIELNNPEQWDAYPLIHIVGSGTLLLVVNDLQYDLNGVDDEIYLDCLPERRLAYHDLGENGSRGRIAVFPDHAFPKLKPGNNVINVNYATSATIIPRWRTLC